MRKSALFIFSIAASFAASHALGQETPKQDTGFFCETQSQAEQMISSFVHDGTTLARAAELVNRNQPQDVCTFHEVRYEQVAEMKALQLSSRAVFIIKLNVTAWRTSQKESWVDTSAVVFGGLLLEIAGRGI